jgi:hypothetical protein
VLVPSYGLPTCCCLDQGRACQEDGAIACRYMGERSSRVAEVLQLAALQVTM